MRNIGIIGLSVVLAAAIISGLLLYGRFQNTRDELLISEKKISELNEKLTNLNRENSTLQDQIRRNAEDLGELKRARARMSKLEERIESSQSHIRYLEEEIARAEYETEGLHRELSALKAASATAESKMAHMKSSYEAQISEHRNKFESARAHISELEEGLRGSQSRIRSLERQIAEEEVRSGRLLRQLSDLKGAKAQVESKIGQLKATYEALISDLKQEIEKREVTINSFEEKISVAFVDRILFEFGEASISPEGEEMLQKVGEILKRAEGRQIRVVGHTDNIPILPEYRYKFPSNWELSAARAAAVVRELEKRIGLDPRNLEAVGRSLYEPVASNENDEGRAQNRRVEIIVAPKIE